MALYNLSLTHHSRGGKTTAANHSRYITRGQEVGAKHAAYLTRESPPSGREDDLEATWSWLPSWAASPHEFWRAADTYERKNGSIYSELRMALPRELDLAQRQELTRAFVEQELAAHYFTVALHNPKSLSGGEQPHAHIMFSLRERDGIERPKEQFFRRANRTHPERGGARKSRAFNFDRGRDRVIALRKSWASLTNAALERAGRAERVDHRSLQAQGIQRVPEPKLSLSDTQRIKAGQQPVSRAALLVKAIRQLRVKELELERLLTTGRGGPGRAVTAGRLRAQVTEAQARVRQAHLEWQQERTVQAHSLAAARGPDGRPWYDSFAWEGPDESIPRLWEPLRVLAPVAASERELEREHDRTHEGEREQDDQQRCVTQIDDLEHDLGWER